MSFEIDRYSGIYYNPYKKIINELVKGNQDLRIKNSNYITVSKLSKKNKVLNNIKKVIFNDPATIVIWKDGTKTVVKCGIDDKFDEEKGLAMAIAKHALGNDGVYYEVFKKWLPKTGE